MSSNIFRCSVEDNVSSRETISCNSTCSRGVNTKAVGSMAGPPSDARSMARSPSDAVSMVRPPSDAGLSSVSIPVPATGCIVSDFEKLSI